MKVKVDKFCSLSTSPSWQAWLFHLNGKLYHSFMKQLQESRGCNQNRDIMIELLKEIEKIEFGTDKLFDFLQKHYPHMIVKDDGTPVKPAVKTKSERQPRKADDIFPYFNPAIVTYPRRQVFDGDNLERRTKEFLVDKLKSDYVIVDGKSYIEYLERRDITLSDQIPARNWMIAAWRLRSDS
jgi:hypothetical protein